MSTRREFLLGLAAAGALAQPGFISRIEHSVLWRGRSGGITWFHLRACAIPARPRPRVFMTLQQISGSDFYGPVHWSESADLGATWSTPALIPGMGRRTLPDGTEEGFCDTVPEYHRPSASVLALAANVYYRDGKLTRPNEGRWPAYIIRSSTGRWSDVRRLEWDNPEATAIYTSNCSQRVTLGDGRILVPLSYAPIGRLDRAVCTVLCTLKGDCLKIEQAGNEHRLPVGRGLLEPSLARFRNSFWMTIRAEDGRGYVTVSNDGLKWAEIRPWCWQDGEPLVLSSTQQRWLVHSERLFLVYTRKTLQNTNVMRWRSPLFLAEVDERKLALLRDSERVVFPMSGDGVKEPDTVAHLGNFHTNAVTPKLSFVTVGETLPKQGYRGDALLARVFWSRPNRFA
jgi:hypothetical protein